MQPKLTIQKIEKVNQLSYLQTFHIHYLTRSGMPRIWEFVSRSNIDRLNDEISNGASYSDGTTIFATDPTGKYVALIKEYRIGAGKYMYALPAGLADAGESIADTAIREFKEETGLTLEIKHISKARYTSVGLSNERVNMVYGTYTGTPSNTHIEDSEDIEVVIVDRADCQTLLEHQEVPIRTAIALENYFKLNPFCNNMNSY